MKNQLHPAGLLESRQEGGVQRKASGHDADSFAFVPNGRASRHRERHWGREGGLIGGNGSTLVRYPEEVESEKRTPFGQVVIEIPAARGLQEIKPLERRISRQDLELLIDPLLIGTQISLQPTERGAEPLRRLCPDHHLDPLGKEVHRHRKRDEGDQRRAGDETCSE